MDNNYFKLLKGETNAEELKGANLHVHVLRVSLCIDCSVQLPENEKWGVC